MRPAVPVQPSSAWLQTLFGLPSRQCRSLRTAAQRTTPARTSPCRTAGPPPANCRAAAQKRGYQYKTVEEAKSRYRAGPFSWKAGLVFVATGAGLVWYFEHEKERMKRLRIVEAGKGVGKAKVGGPFELIDQDGRPFTSEDLKGKYALMYFGFSHCPDICPEELDKMARMYDIVEAKMPGRITPVFVTADPQRDTPPVIKQYLSEFHPRFVGLTGSYDAIKAMCKVYRVYFSTPSDVKPGQDYLVDHSIYFYLMDPEGDFVEALGRQHGPEEAAKVIVDHMKDWRGPWKRD